MQQSWKSSTRGSFVKAAALAVFMVFSCLALAADDAAQWSIKSDQDGNLVSAAFFDKDAAGPSEIVIQLDSVGESNFATFNYPSGFKRNATAGEVQYYWIDRKGRHAVWKHLYDNGQLQVIKPEKSGVLPTDWYGKTTMAITKGRTYIGKLLGMGDNNESFFLETRMDRIQIYNVAVVELCQRISTRPFGNEKRR